MPPPTSTFAAVPTAPGRAARSTGRGPFGILLALVVAAACSSSDDPPPFPDPDLAIVETNPDGDAYPTDRIGGTKRSGTRPGDRMPNLTFRAYRSGRAGGLETVSIAEYFDPKQTRHKVLHLQVAATWCAICSSELEATMSVVGELEARGIRFLEVIVSGATAGKGPALEEVDAWIDRHKTSFPTGIDVAARRLGAIGVSGAAMPHDILIDTRTMEILDSSVGAPVDVAKYVLEGLRFVEENPPSY
ncbi:MAG: redoxin domain-containing protein [Labilithrix sp.]|nr:redoxin domain-containing protein [Labilithrix sp.]